MGKYLPRILIGVVVGIVLYVLMAALVGPGFQATWTAVFGAIATAYILSNLAGNRKVAVASGADKAKALELTPAPGQALLVVAREGFVAKMAGLNLALDGADFAQVKSPAFTTLEIAPGAHTLTCGFGGLAGPQNKPGSYEFNAAAGAVVAVTIGVSMGALQNSFKFTPADDVAALRSKLNGMPMVVAGS